MDASIRRRLDFASRSNLFAFANTAVIIPVSLVAITRELGLSLTQAGALSLVGSVIQFAILLGSIPIAAAWGKIRPLRWGLWILGAGLLLFTRIGGFAGALMVAAVIALGQAIMEALITPLVEDIHPGDDGTNQTLMHAFWPMGVIFATLVVGEALSRGVSWRAGFLGLGLLCLVVGVLYPHRDRATLPRSRADFSHAGEILSSPLFWVMGFALFVAGGAEGGFTYWSASYIQLEYGTLARAGGLGTAFFALGMAAGRILASRFATRLGLKRILLGCSAAAVMLGSGLFFIRSLVALYAAMVIMGLFIAPFWPSIQTYAVRRIGADPTMVMVLLSCFGVVGFSTANFIMGVVGDAAGLRVSFLVAPLLLLVLLVLMLMEGRFDGEGGRRRSP